LLAETPDTTPAGHGRNKSLTVSAVVLLLGITLGFYYGLWWPGLVLIKRDAYRFFIPLKQYMIERLAAGGLPQWFPYEALGRPFIGATHTGVFHPFTALYLLLPVHDAYRAATLISCLLAALGAFTLGRMLALSRAGALVAGLVFALSGYVVSLTDNLTYLYSTCLLPFFCAALEKALVARRAWTAAPAVIWATVFLHGDVQTGYYYGFVALLWAALRAPVSYRETALRLALAAGLAVLLAGVQLGPAWAVFAGSDRARPAQFQDQAVIWSTHPLRLVTMLASPIAEGRNLIFVARYLFDVTKHNGLWAESLYLGIPVMGLALLGAWTRRDLRVLIVLGGTALLLALGRFGGLYGFFYHMVPFWSAFRYPEKLMGVATFAAAMLAGAGFDALRGGRGRLAPWLIVALVCAGAGLGLRTETAGAWTEAAFGVQPNFARGVTGAAGAAFFYSAAAALGVWVVLVGTRKGAFRREALLACLVAVVALDLARVNLGAYHTGPAEAATFTPPFANAIEAREGRVGLGRFRIVSLPELNVVLPPDVTQWLGFDGVSSVERRHALDLEHNAQFHLESAHHYLVYGAAFTTFLEKGVGFEAAARFNVAYYISRWERWTDPAYAPAVIAELPEYDLALVRNPIPAKPRAYLSRRPERSTVPVEPAALLLRSDFLNNDLDVVETAASLPDSASGGQATIERYEPELVRVRVDTPEPAVLILLDAYEPGWTAALEDGIKLPILRANVLVRAVVVPAGQHTVSFRYRTPLLTAGAGVSLLGCAICVAMLLQAGRHARRHQFIS